MDRRPLNAQTTICAVIGNPVEHSLSPAIHNAAFAVLGLNWAYVAFTVLQLDQAVAGVRALGIRGVSVTIPHKVAALSLVDSLDETARMIGSINTIVNTGGHLAGFNSDGAGALQALRDAGGDPAGRRVVVLGSGGAARAIAVTMALQSPPEKLTILGELEHELQKLSSDISEKSQVASDAALLTPAALAAALNEADLLINATPVGMHPHTGSSLVPAHLFRKDLLVFDIIYNPRKTKLLREAEQAGCRTLSGIEMFLHQAAIQFQHWTGLPAPVDVMRAVLEKHFA